MHTKGTSSRNDQQATAAPVNQPMQFQTRYPLVILLRPSLADLQEIQELVQLGTAVLVAPDPGVARDLLVPTEPSLDVYATHHSTSADCEDGLRIDLGAHCVIWAGAPVEVSEREFQLLLVLARNLDRAVSFDALSRMVWDVECLGDVSHVWSAVKRLRQKLRRCDGLRIASVRGYGFRLVTSGLNVIVK